jgi:putative hydrolase of the HAD superfamily
MQQIKNIIFDLGGIFLEVDYPKTEQAFFNLGVANFNHLFTHNHASPLFELLETGKVTTGEFYDLFRQASGINLTNQQIKGAWNAMLGSFYMDALQWLQPVKQRYNIYLFSNTNQIHEDAFVEIFRQQTGQENFNDNFIKAYYSHKLGIRKPYPESFKAILAEQNLDASETVFIDDSAKNVQGAVDAGLQGIFLPPPKSLTELEF